MSVELSLWNQKNSGWRALENSPSIVWDGSQRDSISAHVTNLPNSAMAPMEQATVKGRASASSSGPPTDLTGLQLAAILPDASTTQRGVIEHATDAEIAAAATGNTALTALSLKTGASAVGLTDAATIAIDWAAAPLNFSVTLSGNRVLGNPTNGIPGQWREIIVQGSGTADRTLTFASQYGGAVPTLSDIDNAKWYLISVKCVSASHFLAFASDASPP